MSADLSICTAFKWLDRSDLYCGEPALGVNVTGCMHEHLGRRGICADCAVTTQRMAVDDVLICTWCDEGPDAHECPVVSRIEWNSGEVTVIQQFPVAS